MDVGCGSGILSLQAARSGFSMVIASDISHRAARTAKENSMLNGLSHVIDVVVGDALTFLRDSAVDFLVFNPPMTPSPTPVGRYTWGGYDGKEVMKRVIEDVDRVLRDNGRVLFTICSLVGYWAIQELERAGYELRVVGYYVQRASSLIERNLDFIRNLEDARIIYVNWRPCITVVIVSASKLTGRSLERLS